jgi:hypothetical protein
MCTLCIKIRIHICPLKLSSLLFCLFVWDRVSWCSPGLPCTLDPLPPKCWDYRHMPPLPALLSTSYGENILNPFFQLFETYNTLPFSTVTLSCSSPPQRLVPIQLELIDQTFTPSAYSPQPLVTTTLEESALYTLHRSEIMAYLSFSAWLISLNIKTSSTLRSTRGPTQHPAHDQYSRPFSSLAPHSELFWSEESSPNNDDD